MNKVNKSGQAMGRKGIESRARLLDAARDLLETQPGSRLTASKVARAANLASQTFYLYFEDIDDALFELCAAASTNGEKIIDTLDCAWPDSQLQQRCLVFVDAYYRHWEKNRSVLNYRNFQSDAGDTRFIDMRHRTAMPIVERLAGKLTGSSNAGQIDYTDDIFAQSIVVYTSMERLAARPDHRMTNEQRVLPTEKLIAAQTAVLHHLIQHARGA